MATIDETLAPAMRTALELFGEQLTIHNETYVGTHPQERTSQWEDAEPITVQGRITENQRPMDAGDTSSQRVSGEYHIFLDAEADVRDGRSSDQERASTITDEAGNRYEVLRVTDEHNGLVRCQASAEVSR